MSPDDAFNRIVDRAVWRARVVAAAESAAAGAAVAAFSVPLGLMAAVAIVAWRSRRTSRRAVLRRLEHAEPRAGNVLITADELWSGGLATPAAIRDRVVSEAAALAGAIDIGALFPWRRPLALAAAAMATWAAMVAIDSRMVLRSSPGGTRSSQQSSAAAARASSLRLSVTIEPPPYTHLPAATLTDPEELHAVERSAIVLSIRTDAARVVVDLTGDAHPLSRSAQGSFAYRATLTRSGYVLITADDGSRRMIPVTVTPDALPAVRIVAPGRDLVYGDGNPRIAFSAEATDDFGLRVLTLRYTKVSGSGEQFAFQDGEIPLTIVKRGDRDWTATAARTLAELHLAEGDMFVYRAVASDMRPGGGEAASDTFFIEVSKIGVLAGDAFTLPEEETRYALSQQMLIVKTDRLHRRRASIDRAELVEASQALAVEQRMIRSEFVFMLGGEIEDEEVEAEQSVEVQAGRLANRGQRDIRNAAMAMSQAEKLLTAADTAGALVAERAAVDALQRAFSRERYILRALATRSQLDPGRRLSGVIDQATGWRRLLADAPANRRALLLQSVLAGLSAPEDPRALSVLAELAIRIDPASAPLRQVAADLQRLADRWAAADVNARRRGLDEIAAAVAAEAKRALADPPADFRGAR